MTERLAACGKVFLAGEYAVLEAGRPALVAGIDRKLHATVDSSARGFHLVHAPSGATWSGGGAPEQLRFAARAAILARGFCRGSPDLKIVFEGDLAVDGRKLGLGGSAAACVLAVRAVCRACGRTVSDDDVVALAAAAHWAEQGGAGSGADVAAAALGGVLEVRSRVPWRSPDEVMTLPPQAIAASRPLEVERVRTPPGLRLVLAYAGTPADTRALVGAVRRFAHAEPQRWNARADAISGVTARLRAALEQGDPTAAVVAVRDGAATMAALGEEAGVPILTPALQRICVLAASAGAAAKPSGAGGGDCAVIVAFGDDARDRAEAALRPEFPVFRVAPA